MKVEPIFHPDSYGYRPYRSALNAVAVCRERCWKTDWVIDLDIQKFFDSVDHDLMVKAVEAHADVPWVVLYVKRWLTARWRCPTGRCYSGIEAPAGSAVSPMLANLFMHYAFDAWMARESRASGSSVTRTYVEFDISRLMPTGGLCRSWRERAGRRVGTAGWSA